MFFYSIALQAMPTSQSVQLVSSLAASDLDVKWRKRDLLILACALRRNCAILVLN